MIFEIFDYKKMKQKSIGQESEVQDPQIPKLQEPDDYHQITDVKLLAGINKKSFELYYHGGSIWSEHLDGIFDQENLVIAKFLEDYKTFSRPSATSFIIINLDETYITEAILGCIVKTFVNSSKQFKKIAFVGVGKKDQKIFRSIQEKRGCVVSFFKDYEKAKEWLLP